MKDKKLILSFLDGYEVGDGSVLVRNGLFYGICITVKELEIKNILEEMFTKIYKISPRIRKTKGSFEICYSNVHLMIEFILDGHFSSSSKQWKKLINSYLKKEYTRSHIRYWLAIKNKEKSVEKLSKLTKRSHWAVRDAMKIDSKLGLIKIERGRIKNKRGPYHVFYSLTNKGKNLLNILRRFEKCEKK